MTFIYKYSLHLVEKQTIKMPYGSIIIAVQLQFNVITLWVRFAESKVLPLVNRIFSVHGTGHPIDESEIYLGTVQQGSFVWHIFEIP
jgi:hypothetical protein